MYIGVRVQHVTVVEAQRREVLFVSYARPDRAVAQWVAEQLRSDDVLVLLDVTEWAVGSSFVEAMEDALRRCDRMLALLSTAYLEKDRFTRHELNAMLARPVHEVERRLVVIRLEDIPLPELLRSYIRVDLFELSEERRRAALLSAVRPHATTESLAPAAQAGWLMRGPEGSEGVRRHVTRRALGQRSVARGGDLFRGRSKAISTIIDWLRATLSPGQPLVVTGQPGAGKSAVVARAVLDLEAAAMEDDRSLGLVFHARSATAADFYAAVAAVTGIAVPDSADSMVEALQTASPPTDGFWSIVVDALDEAATEHDRNQLAHALVELAGLASTRVVVATRPLGSAPNSTGRYAPGALLSNLGVQTADDPCLVDLDTDAFFDQGGLESFIVALLKQDGATTPAPPAGAWLAYRARPQASERLAQLIAAQAGRNYLVAALTAEPLSRSKDALDPESAGFDPTALPTSVGEALEKYLQGLTDSQRAYVRGLLVSLAYARGEGIHDEVWLAFAAALGYPADIVSLDALRDSPAADYLLQSFTVDGHRVTRLFHQALVDELLAQRPPRADEEKLLGGLIPVPPATWATTSPYARLYAADHAAAAGQLARLLHDPAFLMVADLARLLRLVPDNPPAALVPIVAVLRSSVFRLYGLAAPGRAFVLALAAAQLGYADLFHQYRHEVAPTVMWAHPRFGEHQEISDHGGLITTVAVGHAGGRDLLVTGGGDGSVRLWDLLTLQSVAVPSSGHAGVVLDVALARIGDRDVIVSGGSDCTVRLWDLDTLAPIGEPFVGHARPVNGVAVGRAGDRVVIVSGSADTTVRIWDPQTGRLMIDPLRGHSLEVNAVATLGERVISGSADGTVRLWDLVTGRPIGTPLLGHTREVNAVAAAGDYVLSGSADGTARVWQVSTGEAVGAAMTRHGGPINAVVCQDNLVVTASADGTLRRWDLTSQEPIGLPLTGHTSWVSAAALGHDRIVSVGGDATVRVWSVDTGEPMATSQSRWLHTVALGSTAVVSGGADGVIRRWDPATGRPLGSPLEGHSEPVNSVAVGRAADREVIVSASADATVRAWDLATGEPLGAPFVGHTSWVTAVAVGRAAGRDVVVSGGRDAAVRLWDLATGEPWGEPLQGHASWVTAVTLAQVGDRDIVVSGGRDMTVRVWDLATRTQLAAMDGHEFWVSSLAVSRFQDRDVIVSGGFDLAVRVWDLATNKPLGGPLLGHTAVVRDVTVGRMRGRDVIVSGGDDSIRIWDAATRTPIHVLHTLDPVGGIALRDDTLAIACGNAVIGISI